jgi:hypothetical protein
MKNFEETLQGVDGKVVGKLQQQSYHCNGFKQNIFKLPCRYGVECKFQSYSEVLISF